VPLEYRDAHRVVFDVNAPDELFLLGQQLVTPVIAHFLDVGGDANAQQPVQPQRRI
jgi:hypothetical protein